MPIAPHRAWVAHHQHRQGGEHRALRVELAGDRAARQPAQRRQQRQRQDGGGVEAQDAVYEVQDAGLQGAGVLDVAHDLREEALLPDGAHADQQGARPVDRPAGDLVAIELVHGHRLAGYQRLVDRRAPGLHLPVHGHALAGAHAHQVADDDLLDRHLVGLTVAEHAGGVGLQVEQALDRLGAARLDEQRQPLTEQVVGGDQHRHGEEGSRW